jgi:hypothetical protein
MGEKSIKEYAKNVILQDAIVEIFRIYLKSFQIEDRVPRERLDLLIKKFNDTYHEYVTGTFEDLNIQTLQIDEVTYIGVEELMIKIAGIISSKLAAELLLLEMCEKL